MAFSTYSLLPEFLAAIVAVAPSIENFLAAYPGNVMARLGKLDASDGAKKAWAESLAAT